MKIGIIVAMEEEFKALEHIFNTTKMVEESPYKVYQSTFKNNELTAIISKIGKTAAASATTLLLSKYLCDIVINVGSCGGLNQSQVNSIILSNTTGYCDVDVQAFGYKLGQLPQQPEYFTSPNNLINFEELLKHLKNQHPSLLSGTVITGDSFINDQTKVEQIKHIYENTLAVEMEASAIAQVCHLYNKDFVLIKKVSDMADIDASDSFKKEINKMDENTNEIITDILEYLAQ